MMLQSLITAFRANQLDPSAEELADAVWFALQIVPLEGQQTDTNLLSSDKSSQSPVATKRQPDATKSQPVDTPSPPKKETEGSHLHPWTSKKPVANFIGSRSVRTPAVPMLPDKLSLGRALRPLMRRVSSRNRYILNEEATVQQIAETRRKVWLPILKGAPERWLKVALVIDKSASMVIWQPTITELRRFLEDHGAFRTVETWHLELNQANPNEVQLYASGKDHSRLCSPKELIDPTQRTLILVVSDCVSKAWYTGVMAKLLFDWGQIHLVALVQMLPSRLWPGTALGEVLSVNLSATTSNSINTRLTIEEKTVWGLDDKELQGMMKIPIVTLEPESLGNWARLVTGKPEAKVPGVLLKADPLDFSSTSPSSTVSATERLEAFYAAASPQAQKLAGYLAAVPLTLDVMRLIQQVMLPESRQVHLAEVFLGGLLKRVSPSDILPQQAQYDFHDGVRELLLDSVLVPEVLKVVSTDLERRFGQSFDFQAFLPDPTAINSPQIDAQGRPFAHLSVKVLRRLGGEYAQLALRIRKDFEIDYVKNIFDRIEVVKGDITEQQVDAIVNCTDSWYSGAGGVDSAIHSKAGDAMRTAALSQLKDCLPGEAKITKGYDLLVPFIIHTIGPVWHGGNNHEIETLSNCYRNCLELAKQHSIKTIAFPSISTGAFDFPVNLAAEIAIREVSHFLMENTSIEKVILVYFGKATYGYVDNERSYLQHHLSKLGNDNHKIKKELEKMPLNGVPSWLIGSWKGHWDWKDSTRNARLIIDVNNPGVATMVIQFQKSGVETIVEQLLQVELKGIEVHLIGTDYKFIELGNAINVWRLDTFVLKVTSDRNRLEGVLFDNRQVKVDVYFIREQSV